MNCLLSCLAPLVALAATDTSSITGDEPEVELTIVAPAPQPSSGPITIEVSLKNIGDEDFHWRVVPGRYPGAEQFIVHFRSGSEPEWHAITATNGQLIEHRRSVRLTLQPGESIIVPLALHVPDSRGGHVRVVSRDRRTKEPAEAMVWRSKDQRVLDQRRATLISAVVQDSPPFWRHVAQEHDDPVVHEAILKIMTVDNALLAQRAAWFLQFKKGLPPSCEDELVLMVDRWLGRVGQAQWQRTLPLGTVVVAIRTESSAAREAVLRWLPSIHDPHTLEVLIGNLAHYPGDRSGAQAILQTLQELRRVHADRAEISTRIEQATRELMARLESLGAAKVD